MSDENDELSDVWSNARETAREMYRRYPPIGPLKRPAGYARGIDYYSQTDFIRVIANIFLAYKRKSGRYPDLITPRFYTEKLNSMKLLAWMKIPESGNKLMTAHFIPQKAPSYLKTPQVIWRSAQAVLPPNEEIPNGAYFVKTNHGSGFVKRLQFPLSKDSRVAIGSLGSKWLGASYGHQLGEWWYNVFQKALFLERAVTSRFPSVVVLLFVFRGKVRLISIEEKPLDGSGETRINILDPSFNLLPEQSDGTERVPDFILSKETKLKLIAAAEAVGRQFEAVRVDLIPGDDGHIYLNEVTFSSDAGLPFNNKDRDLELGRYWGDCSFLRDH